MTPLPTDWANRWLGGFCALGAVGGLPVRGPDYAAHPAFAQALTLPSETTTDAKPPTVDQVIDAWSTALGGMPVMLVRSVARARALLLQATEVQPGEPVGLPANATRPLVEAVKQHKARPHFLDLDVQLAVRIAAHDIRITWAQPISGLPVAITPGTGNLWLDYADTLPDVSTDPPISSPDPAPHAILWGLHLSPDEAQAGALLAFPDANRLHTAVTALLSPDDLPDLSLALAQCIRLTGPDGLAARQRRALAEVWRGLDAAAGLPLLPLSMPLALAHGIAVRIPEACDAATFYAYVCGEHTPVQWIPRLRPLHYAAIRAGNAPDQRATAAHLNRWLLAPVGPDYTSEEISHTILGIVKASDYLGVRWYTNPTRAAEYAAMMEAWYGSDHDGYRPAFVVANDDAGAIHAPY